MVCLCLGRGTRLQVLLSSKALIYSSIDCIHLLSATASLNELGLVNLGIFERKHWCLIESAKQPM